MIVEDKEGIVSSNVGVHNENKQMFHEEDERLQNQKHEDVSCSLKKMILTMQRLHGTMTPLT